MSEPVQAGFYSIRAASVEELVPLVSAGDAQARDELVGRLPDRLVGLLDLYLVAYGQDRARAVEALGTDIERLKVAA